VLGEVGPVDGLGPGELAEHGIESGRQAPDLVASVAGMVTSSRPVGPICSAASVRRNSGRVSHQPARAATPSLMPLICTASWVSTRLMRSMSRPSMIAPWPVYCMSTR
jgi:hypothetical protein